MAKISNKLIVNSATSEWFCENNDDVTRYKLSLRFACIKGDVIKLRQTSRYLMHYVRHTGAIYV